MRQENNAGQTFEPGSYSPAYTQNATHVRVSKLAQERHFKVSESARMWHMDPKTVRKWFKGRLDVLHDPHPATRGKRAYTTLRIPESIAYAEYAKRTGRAV
jgi:hypothetical protein